MQNKLVATFAAVLLSACAQSAQKAVLPAPAPGASEATVVFTRTGSTETRLYAQSESGTGAAVALSAKGARAEYGGTLKDHRIVYTVHAQDGSVKQLRVTRLDGTGDELLASPAASTVRGVRALQVAGDGTLIVQVARMNGAAELLSGKTALTHLADGRFLALDSTQLVYLANAASAVAQVGDVRALRLDGTGDRALGLGGQEDEFHGLAGHVALLTVHRSTDAQVRAQDLQSGALKSLKGRGVLFAGTVLVAQQGASWVMLDGQLASRTLKLAANAKPLTRLPDGSVAAFVPGSGVVAADDHASRTLDTFAATASHSARVVNARTGARLVYTANDADGSHLRSALLDGHGAITLASGRGSELLFSSELSGGRILFYRTKGTEPGGWLHSVKVDGGDEKAVGDQATGTLAAADHDFGGVTKSGRVIFEAELTEFAPSQLYVLDGDTVRSLTGASEFSTMAAIVE